MARAAKFLVAAVFGIAAAGVALFWLHARNPAVVRGLPEGDAILYMDLRPLRDAGMLSPSAVPRSPGYADFVAQSGFDFERDLDQAALSLDGPPTAPADATLVLSGRFGPRFAAYLAAHALRRQSIAGVQAFTFPGWARPQQLMMVALLGPSRVLVTNRAQPAAAIATARSWWAAAPSLWHAGGWLPTPPLGYAAVNALRLAADRSLDGSAPPWRGAETLQARLAPSVAGVILTGNEVMASPTDAAATLRWLNGQRQAIAALLSASHAAASDPSADASIENDHLLAQLLKNLSLSQRGSDIRFTLTLDRDVLTRWQ